MIPKDYRRHFTGLILQTLAITALVLLSTSPSYANSRTDAKNAIDQLKHSGVAQLRPDEMGSIAATFSTAEQYLHENNREMAERYFLLTMQKARILKSSLIEPARNQEQATPFPPSNGPLIPGAAPAADPDSTSIPAETVSGLQKPDVSLLEETSRPTADAEPEPVKKSDLETISSDKLVGNASTYTVVKNDTLRLISAKLGVSRQQLAQLNKLEQKTLLRIGQKLKYNNRKIVPQRMSNGIVINIPDRTLYYFNNGKLEDSLPVALGVPKKNEKFDWTTPTGKFKIIAKQKDPTWYVPLSIQSEMEVDGKDIVTSMPPGPTNPLGKYAFKTSLPGILIHSTTKPWSIYSFASHGCIRVNPEHMEGFFKKIRVNTAGVIIYQPVKLAITENGRVFLEVHRDAYGKSPGLQAMAKQLIEKNNLSKRVDWNKVESVIRHKEGLAEDITL